jgi:hypothetical protein
MNQITVLFSQPWAETLGSTLLHFIWQGAAIALLLGILRLRLPSPQSRHAAACLSLCVAAIAPLATFAWLATNTAPAVAQTPILDAPATPGATVAAAGAAASLMPWLVIAWLSGVASCLPASRADAFPWRVSATHRRDPLPPNGRNSSATSPCEWA